MITFKARLNKAGRNYYVYIPKAWNPELESYHKERRRVKVMIELDGEESFEDRGDENRDTKKARRGRLVWRGGLCRI